MSATDEGREVLFARCFAEAVDDNIGAAARALNRIGEPVVARDDHGAVRLRIHDGCIETTSLECAGYASAAMPDFAGMKTL